MATIDRKVPDRQERHTPDGATAPCEVGLPRASTPKGAPADPSWFGPPPRPTERWDWLETAHETQGGLEVTEHEVPEGWFVQTFGLMPDPTQVRR